MLIRARRWRGLPSPTEWVKHRPVACGGSGGDLAGASVVASQTRQVLDSSAADRWSRQPHGRQPPSDLSSLRRLVGSARIRP
jgi:hypothetical protein